MKWKVNTNHALHHQIQYLMHHGRLGKCGYSLHTKKIAFRTPQKQYE